VKRRIHPEKVKIFKQEKIKSYFQEEIKNLIRRNVIGIRKAGDTKEFWDHSQIHRKCPDGPPQESSYRKKGMIFIYIGDTCCTW